jgi:hypothetical protein
MPMKKLYDRPEMEQMALRLERTILSGEQSTGNQTSGADMNIVEADPDLW